jgi:hypothetical protein
MRHTEEALWFVGSTSHGGQATDEFLISGHKTS